MKVFQNIEFVQVNFDAGSDKFYFPENTRLHGKVIDEISFYVAPAGKTINSPFDALQLLDASKLENLYVEIVKDSQTVLHTRVSALLSDITKSGRISVNSAINLNLCNLTYVGDISDLQDKCILVYFTYETMTVDEYEPSNQQKAISINTSAAATRLSELIDYYIAAQGDTVKCIECQYIDDAKNYFYLDVRDKGGRSFRIVPGQRMKIATSKPIGANNQYQKLYLADYNIDFKNSWIYRASTTGSMQVQLIFTY